MASVMTDAKESIQQILIRLDSNIQGGEGDAEIFHVASALHSATCMIAAAVKAGVADPPAKGECLSSTHLGQLADSFLDLLHRHVESVHTGNRLAWLLCSLVQILTLDAQHFSGVSQEQLSSSFEQMSARPWEVADSPPGGAEKDRPASSLSGRQLLDKLLHLLASASDSLQNKQAAGGSPEQLLEVSTFISTARSRLSLLDQLSDTGGATRGLRFVDSLAIARMSDAEAEFLSGADPTKLSEGSGVSALLSAIPNRAAAAADLLSWAARTAARSISQGAETGAPEEDAFLSALAPESLRVLAECLERALSKKAATEACGRLLNQAAAERKALEDLEGWHESRLSRICGRILLSLQSILEERPDVPLHHFISAFNLQLVTGYEEAGSDADSEKKAAQAREQLFARHEALVRIEEAQEAARQGKHQFLSGLLHNLAKVLWLEDQTVPEMQMQALGLRPRSSQSGGRTREKAAKPENYLSRTLTYVAELGDELALLDPAPGEAHNYFALLDVPPGELLLKLVQQHGCAPPIFKVAARMGFDLVAVVLDACVEPVPLPSTTDQDRSQATALEKLFEMFQQSAEGEASGESTGGRRTVLERRAGAESADSLHAKAAEKNVQSDSSKLGAGSAVDTEASKRDTASPPAPECSAQQKLAEDHTATEQLFNNMLAAELAFLGGNRNSDASCGALDAARNRKLPSPQLAGGGTEQTDAHFGGKKSRLPGLRGGEEAKLELTKGLLTEIAAVAPLRATVAALVLLLQRRNGLSQGDIPIIPPSSGENDSSRACEAADGGAPRPGPHLRPENAASDLELLAFSMQTAKEQFPMLHRWIEVQLKTNPALADLQEGPAGAFARLSETKRRARIEALSAAGRWKEAIEQADQDPGKGGAPDWLLRAAVDAVAPRSAPSARTHPHHRLAEPSAESKQQQALSHAWCCRIKDSETMAHTALQHLRCWSLECARVAALWAFSRTQPGSSLNRAAEDKLGLLKIYSEAVEKPSVKAEFQIWQNLDRLAESDSQRFVRDLASLAPEAALKAALHLKIAPALLRDVREQQLLSKVQGGEPEIAGILYLVMELKELPLEERASIGLSVVCKLQNLDYRKALVEVLGDDREQMSAAAAADLGAAELGVGALETLPEPWRGRLFPLVLQPGVILEALLMVQEFDAVEAVFEKLPALRDDAMVLHYARRAISFSRWDCFPEPQTAASGHSTPASDGPGTGGASLEPQLMSSAPASSFQRPRGASIRVPGFLTGDAEADARMREEHFYKTAPHARLAQRLASLAAPLRARIGILRTLVSELLLAEVNQPPEHVAGDDAAMERAEEASSIAVRLLDAALQLQDSEGKAAIARDAALAEDLRSLHRKAQLLQMLLSKRIAVSAEELQDEATVCGLCKRLVQGGHFPLAAYTAKRWQLDERFIWEAWAMKLIRTNEYEEAEARIARAFLTPAAEAVLMSRAHPDDVALAMRVAEELEAAPPIDAEPQTTVSNEYERLLRGDSDNEASLDAQEYMQVLRPARQPPKQEPEHRASEHRASERYRLAEKLLRSYCPDRALRLMFEHGHAAAACQLLYPAAAPGSADDNLSGEPVTPRYGSLDDLLGHAVAHDEFRTLLRVLAAGGVRGRAALLGLCGRLRESVRKLVENGREPSKICSEEAGDEALLKLSQERLLLYFYKGCLSLQMPEAAGFASIRLAMLSESSEGAIVHLENANVHFQDSLDLVQRNALGKVTASEASKLNAQQLTSLLKKIRLQIAVHKLFLPNPRGSPFSGTRIAALPGKTPTPEQLHLFLGTEGDFGNEGNSKAAAEDRRLEIFQAVAARDFELAFAIVHAFDLNPTRAYSAAARRLAEAADLRGVQALLEDVKGTSTDHEFDQVVAAAASHFKALDTPAPRNAWGFFAKAQPADPVASLVSTMHSSHCKVTVLLQLQRLEEAAAAAIASGSSSLVRAVAEEARRLSDERVLGACESALRDSI